MVTAARAEAATRGVSLTSAQLASTHLARDGAWTRPNWTTTRASSAPRPVRKGLRARATAPPAATDSLSAAASQGSEGKASAGGTTGPPGGPTRPTTVSRCVGPHMSPAPPPPSARRRLGRGST
eukprot:scaffold13372_cov112-Isochrysis_galbana.AAC.4